MGQGNSPVAEKELRPKFTSILEAKDPTKLNLDHLIRTLTIHEMINSDEDERKKKKILL